MIETTVYSDIIKVIFVFVLGTTALIAMQRTLASLFTIYAVQSWLIAAIALLLYLEDRSVVLLLLALLTVISKAVLIPHVLRRIQSSMNIRRDAEFRYLTPITAMLASAVMIFLVYRVFSHFESAFPGDMLFFFGAVIGVSLVLMGMMVIFSRKRIITKIVGYLTMENGVLLFGIFMAELPFIVELLIIIDLIILVILAAVLAFGINTTVESFHKKLQSFIWFKDE